MPFKSHEQFMSEYLADPEMAAAYLNACLEDGNPWLIADAFKTVEQIHGSIGSFRIKFERVAPRPRSATPKPRLLHAAPKPRRTSAKRTRRVAA